MGRGPTTTGEATKPFCYIHHLIYDIFRATNPSIRAYLAKNAGIPENESRNPTNYVNLAIGYYFKRYFLKYKSIPIF